MQVDPVLICDCQMNEREEELMEFVDNVLVARGFVKVYHIRLPSTDRKI